MKVHSGEKKVGCLPGVGSVTLLVVGIGIMVGAYFYAGPSTSEVGAFVDAVRRGHEADAEPFVVPALLPRLRRALADRPADEPIVILSGGTGPRGLHFRVKKGERCYEYTGGRDVPVYVSVVEGPDGWRITEVSTDATRTDICRGD